MKKQNNPKVKTTTKKHTHTHTHTHTHRFVTCREIHKVTCTDVLTHE